jgi:1-phosphofructokinase family hexose kinase
MPGTASRAAATPSVRRLVCVAPNASVDKITAVDALRAGEIHRPVVLSVVAGGKALNAGRAAATLGLEVIAVPVLAGHAGRWVADGLAADGIEARPVWIEGETRECTSVLDRATGRLTEFYEAGPAMDEAAWGRVEAAIADAVAQDPAGTIVLISGSLPAGAPADAHARAARVVREAGGRAVIDVGGKALAGAMAERPWLAKVNALEASQATGLPLGGEAEAVAAARALRAAGAELAFVSRGADGAVLVDADGAGWRIGPPPELGAFPVGSGDSLMGGFAAALAQGHDAPEAARRGAAAAAANALHPGQGRVDPTDVARLLPGIALEALL